MSTLEIGVKCILLWGWIDLNDEVGVNEISTKPILYDNIPVCKILSLKTTLIRIFSLGDDQTHGGREANHHFLFIARRGVENKLKNIHCKEIGDVSQ